MNKLWLKSGSTCPMHQVSDACEEMRSVLTGEEIERDEKRNAQDSVG